MNYYDDILQLGITALIWACWGVIHSLLSSEGVIGKALPLGSRIRTYYRLFYSLFAAITLVLVYWLAPRGNDAPILKWQGALVVAQVALWVLALTMGYLSFRYVSLWHFLGFTALGVGQKVRGTTDKLITWGIYGEIRNPQFLAGLLVLWARDLNTTSFVTNIILSLYLLVGARIEEKRLLQKFGDDYARYMAKVPRFIPRRFPSLQSLFGVRGR